MQDIKKDSTKVQEKQGDVRQVQGYPCEESQDSQESGIMKYLYNVKEYCMEKLMKALECQEVSMLAGLPIPIAPADSDCFVNMIIGDAGVGKSLLSRALMNYILTSEEYSDTVIVYLDLEFQDFVAAQRKFLELLENDRFFMLTPEIVENLKEKYKIKQISLSFIEFIYQFINDKQMHGKRIIVIIDSFEDFIDDTSDDTELKNMFRQLQKLKGVTIIFNHHITKDKFVSVSMKFRGSMVIKAKLTSMLYLKEKIKQNDNEYGFVIETLKMRIAYGGNAHVTAIVNIDDFSISKVDIVDDSEAVKILKTAYFILIKEKELSKTELMNMTMKRSGKSKQKVLDVLKKHEKLFTITHKEKNTYIYSLTSDVNVLDEYLAFMGLGDVSVVRSDVKRKLLEFMSDKDLEAEIDLKVEYQGKVYRFTKLKTIKYELHSISDDLARNILEELQKEEEFLDSLNF